MSTFDLATVTADLHRSHTEFAAAAAAKDADYFSAPSYCKEWTIGRVLSHMGSGAELGTLTIAAVRSGGDPLDDEGRQAVWARWDALDDAAVAAEYIRHEGAFLAEVESVDADEAASMEVPFFTGPISLAEFVGLRLAEHATHRWDVEVMADKDARVGAAGVGFILTRVPTFGRFFAKPDQAPELAGRVVAVDLGDDGAFTIDLHDGVSVPPGAPDTADATLRAPAEAFVRLVYGRLDEAHTPSDVRLSGDASIEALRRLFPGF
ncbi:MAG: maleylpyruvate isomerase family mycothiol-dependent enzyme [Actinomadura sp.]